MFDLPGLEGVEQVVIGAEVVDGNAKPLYIYGERAAEAPASGLSKSFAPISIGAAGVC